MKKKLEILDRQEELLWFEQFTNDEGWKLGCYMAERAKERGIAIAICIRLNSGYTLFQYGPCGTSILNQNWMDRKYNTVKLMDRSSLKSLYVMGERGQTLTDHGLTEEQCVLCGGGFPIRVKGVGNIGAVMVSALPHEEDHAFIIDCLSGYLGIEVPRLTLP